MTPLKIGSRYWNLDHVTSFKESEVDVLTPEGVARKEQHGIDSVWSPGHPMAGTYWTKQPELAVTFQTGETVIITNMSAEGFLIAADVSPANSIS